MRRLLILPAALFAALLLPAAAPAEIVEMGEMREGVVGSCPASPCQALTKVTAYQAKVGPDRSLYKAPSDGRIVAWTVALGDPSEEQVQGFNAAFGQPQAAIVVLRPRERLNYRVVQKGKMTDLTPYLGTRAQFPLVRTLNVREGDVVGITVPTWAPIMQLGQPSTSSWRGSRPDDECSDVNTQYAMLGDRRTAGFRCLYQTVRLTYSATFIPDPKKKSDRDSGGDGGS